MRFIFGHHARKGVNPFEHRADAFTSFFFDPETLRPPDESERTQALLFCPKCSSMHPQVSSFNCEPHQTIEHPDAETDGEAVHADDGGGQCKIQIVYWLPLFHDRTRGRFIGLAGIRHWKAR
jgi:hypothetical protein